MSILKTAAKSGIWLAGFKIVTQILSWLVTIMVARYLSPNDYGLMALASILTGYVEIFSELGLGSAIVQRKNITKLELSSNFWFSMFIGLVFSALAFGLAYPTALLFHEPKVIPITQSISVLFIIGAVMVVPYNVLTRELRFKAIGIIQLISVAISSGAMFWMAYSGFGVWTLIGGTIILRLVTVFLVLYVSKWRPLFHFKWLEVRPFLKFGINVVSARSVIYLFQKADVFIIGKVLGTEALGYYSFAMQLASMPTDKIISVVNQVSFPVFSHVQDEIQKIQKIYLKLTKYLAIVVTPLFLAGALWGDEIILTILGDKWAPIVFLFKIFCISQLIISVTAINGTVHTSMGRAHWVLYFYLLSLLLMPPSLYLSAQYGLEATSIPWLVVYPMLCIIWTWVTLKKLDLPTSDYSKILLRYILVAFFVVLSTKIAINGLNKIFFVAYSYKLYFLEYLLLGGAMYLCFLWLYEKETINELWKLRKM